MVWIMILPFIIGAAVVLQGGIGRRITDSWGLGAAIHLNNAVFFVIAIAFLLVYALAPNSLPEIFRPKGTLGNFRWWYLLPGIFGFCIVAGIPYAMAKAGAFKVIIGLIGAQLFVSLLWDVFVENIPISTVRVVGALLALASAVLVGISS